MALPNPRSRGEAQLGFGRRAGGLVPGDGGTPVVDARAFAQTQR